MFITKKHMSRRTVLKGMGATVALPFLESMLPAMSPQANKAPVRVACIEMVHGSAGSVKVGGEKFMWSPEKAGRDFDLTPSSLLPLEPWRDYVTIVSNTDMRPAEAYNLHEVGGDHFRSSAVFLTQAHPKQTEGSDVYAGTSFDQLYAAKYGQDTPVPSIQLSIEPVDQAGGCAYQYACVYTDTISWATPTKALPMVRDPRLVFDMLFGSGATAEDRAFRRQTDRSILDWITRDVKRLQSKIGPTDRVRLETWLENVREIERRIQRIEARNLSGEARELPDAPAGVPDSVDEHMKLMFDLQALAFAGDITRVSSYKMSRDATGRTFPESGVTGGFHGLSHHGGNEQRVTQYAKLNKYHVSLVVYFMEKLKKIEDMDGKSVLDNSLVLYGSPIGDSNLHNHKRVPLFLAGRAGGALKGHLNHIAPDGTPSANMYLTLLHKLGIETDSFGDSTGEMPI
ncbi:MAG: DUF1552 domain-containing protein [Acidobacteria bacterium]|nr:DUF1552 domain-containing protein [Acidobacteriota bacterium]